MMNFNSSNTVNFSAYYQNNSDKASAHIIGSKNPDKDRVKAGIKQLNSIESSDHIDVTILRDSFTSDTSGQEGNVYIRVSNRDLDLKHQKNPDSLNGLEAINRQIIRPFAITDLTKPETWEKLAEYVTKIRDNESNQEF